MTYKGQFKINKEDLQYYTDLLEQDLEEEEHIGIKDDYIGIATIEFSNGNYITIDLASGGSNYYDNIVLWNKDGQELYCSDCTYEINGFSLFYKDDIYDVEMVVE